MPLISWADNQVTITVNNQTVATLTSNNLPTSNIVYSGNYSGVNISGQMEVTSTTSDGNTSYTYTINSVADMIALSYMVNSGWSFSSSYTFQLANDLNFSLSVLNENSSSTTSEVSNFEPIGSVVPFQANFNGNSKTISNLKISTSTITTGRICYGLFGFLSDRDQTIKDLTIDNATMNISTANSANFLYVGILLGLAGDYNSITNCTVKNSNINVNVNLSKENVCVGSVLGNATIQNVTKCSSISNTVRNEYGYVGGFAGRSTYSNASDFHVDVNNSDVIFGFGTNTATYNKVSNNTITSSDIWADEIGVGLAYSQSNTSNLVPNYIFESNANKTNNNTIDRGKDFNSNATYLYTNKWNLVARLGETFNVLNNNNLQQITNTTFACDMAALGYNYSNNNWSSDYLYATDNMVAGAGYFVWPFNANTAGNNITTDETLNNNSSFTTKVTPTLLTATQENPYTTTNTGNVATGGTNTGYWYALGNPFDKALAVNDIVNITNTNSDSKSCVWMGESNNASAVAQIPQGAKVYVFDSYSQDWDSEIDIIYPGQGFMVAASETQKQVNFRMIYPTNTEQTNSKSISQTNEGIRINCLANGVSSSMYVKQMANAQDGFDINDAYVLFSSNENRVEPYFVIENNAIKYNRYASDNYVCDISFHAQRQATAKISVSDVPQEYVVSILDLATGTETVLEENSFFEIDVEQGENAGKYKIKITKGALSIADIEKVSDVNIWNNKGNIYVSGKDLKSVEVLNTLGQSMMMKQVGGNEYNFSFDNEGTYIIRVKSANGTKTQKVVLTK